MHSLSEFGANVPAFLAKLWKLVDDPETNELISWTEEGTSFYIRDQAQFSRKLLPMYYKHNNMASFIRQLNMYGFHKIVSADAGSLRLDKDEMEFAHQCFLRGHPYLLEHIKRKVGKSQLLSSKQIEETTDCGNGGVVVKAEFMNKVLSEVKQMRGRQETVESRLTSMKQENEALWRELSLLRQKHIKQQTIVNKLIQFLVQLVQPNQRLSKRRYPLMINNVAHPSGKSNGKVTNVNSNDSNMSRSSSGPTIHELDADTNLPDTDMLSNTITLHVPDSELAEVIDTSLEPEVLSPDPEVLESFSLPDPLAISPSAVAFMEVNSSGEQVQTGEALKANSPSPELLLAAPPNDMSPAIVPALLLSQDETPNLSGSQAANKKVLTRSSSAASTFPTSAGPSRSIVTRKSAANASKVTPTSGKLVSDLEQLTGKRELRVLPPRNRRKKITNGKDSLITPKSEVVEPTVQPDAELLLGAALGESDSLSASTLPVIHNNCSTSGSISGSIPSPATNQLVSVPMPESPIPIIHSPVSSPVSHCSMAQSIAMSTLSGPTITDVTSPLVTQPSTSTTTSEQLSPQPSPSGLLSPYDMSLACTSQAGSPAGGLMALKSPSFNRCEINRKEDLDTHVGNMDTELGQLKEFLNNSGMQLDANTLLGLFSDSSENMLVESDGTNFIPKMDQCGNELMYYQPDFMDLAEIWSDDINRSTPPPSPEDILSSELNTPVMMPVSPGFPSPAAKRRRN